MDLPDGLYHYKCVCKYGYQKFCKKYNKKYNCKNVLFLLRVNFW